MLMHVQVSAVLNGPRSHNPSFLWRRNVPFVHNGRLLSLEHREPCIKGLFLGGIIAQPEGVPWCNKGGNKIMVYNYTHVCRMWSSISNNFMLNVHLHYQ